MLIFLRYTAPKLQITVPRYEKVFVLKNGDFVRGSYGFGSNIQIYDSTTGLIKRNLTSSHTSEISPWVFGQLSNGLLVAGYYDSLTILIWDLNALNEEPLKRVFQTNGDLFALTVLKNDDLATGQDDFEKSDIIIRNSQNGSIKHTLVGHTSTVFQILELPNGNLVSCSNDKTVRVWNPSLSSSLVKTINHSSYVYSIAILKNGYLASGLRSGEIEIRNFDTGDLIRTLYGHTNSICWINCLHVLDNGDLLSASYDKTIKVWNPYDGTIKLSNNKHQSALYQLDFLPNGNLLSVSENEIFIW